MEALPMLMMGASMAMRPKTPKPPEPQPPARLPDPDGPDAKAARARRLNQQSASQGRSSTNLTGNVSAAAAPTYANSTLGQ